jgi:transposase InsO family protein
LLATTDVDLWHHRLGHPGQDAMSTLQRLSLIRCNKARRTTVCKACQLGKHVRLPFSSSTSMSRAKFDLIHCDLCTSLVISASGFRYYLVIIDDYSHYYWTFPLRNKSRVSRTLTDFFAYARTQFGTTIRSLQIDNGTEFLNSAVESLLTTNDTTLCLSCPYTSQQNGKAERTICTINDTMRTLMFHAHLPESFWAKALATATFLLNRRPCKAIGSRIPYTRLLGRSPPYKATTHFGFLGVFVILTSHPSLRTSSALAPCPVCFLVTQRSIVVIAAIIPLPGKY